MTTYNVGDRIIMTREASYKYGITQENSTGTIIEVYPGGRHMVDYDYVSGVGDLQSYTVESKYFKLLAPAVVLSPAEVIAKKINLMWKRQKYAKSQQVVV